LAVCALAVAVAASSASASDGKSGEVRFMMGLASVVVP
jgi:outer membrane protein W